ncbi:cutinase family protein [Mycolicibacterium porcinum]|nr:cutinase family protein [Mycolicibacterium porcinum]
MGVRKVSALAGIAAVTATAALGTIATPVSSAAPDCPDIEVVFARGTDEPAGIGNVGKAFVDTLKPMVKGKTVGTYAVQYPASWDFWKAAAGATDMSKRVQATAARCPKTKIVMGGYSQGAAVVDVVATSPVGGLGYSAPLPAAVVPRVASVVVFGNPSARLGQPLTRMSPDFGARTADLCNTNDPICSLGQDWNAHISYPKSGLIKLAAQWVTRHVQPPPPAPAARR